MANKAMKKKNKLFLYFDLLICKQKIQNKFKI